VVPPDYQGAPLPAHQVPILPKVTHIRLQIFVTCIHILHFFTFDQCSLVGHIFLQSF
jgi:hypothetical protein